MGFDFDPDDPYEENIEADSGDDYRENEADVISDEIDREIKEDEMNIENDIGLKEAAVAGGFFGIVEEEGEDEAKYKSLIEKDMNSKEFERPKGAVSLKSNKKESKLPPFEQWVRDVITGKKSLDDEL